MSIKIELDGELCAESGNCVADLPGVFGFGPSGKAETTGPAEGVSKELLIEVARGCPTCAIRLFEAGDEISID